VGILVLVSFVCGLYRPDIPPLPSRAKRSALVLPLAFIPLMLVVDSWAWLLVSLCAFSLLQIAGQQLFFYLTYGPLFERKVLVIGTAGKAIKASQLIEKSLGYYHFAGYIGAAKEPVEVSPDQIVGQMNDINKIVHSTNIHAIVIALTERRGTLAIDKLVSCKLLGTRIYDYPTIAEMLTGKIPVEEINPSWLIQSQGFLITPIVRIVKRAIDIVLSTLFLIFTLPLILVMAVLVRFTSSGPAFYVQQRVGLHGQPFTIYKLRSMTTDAERQGVQWASKNDPRVTPLGAFMRKTRIDELPQLFNVLKGEMSFIGPRPERPELVEEIAKVVPYYRERHAMKPGITGWAQVMYPYGASVGDALEKLRYDLYYIKNLSFFLELMIVIETIQVVLFRKGSR
jgi:sugar transferase (PEP-CTERM system associated)